MPRLTMHVDVSDAYVDVLPRIVNALRGVQVLTIARDEDEDDGRDVLRAAPKCPRPAEIAELVPDENGLCLVPEERELMRLAADAVFRPPKVNETIAEALAALGRLRYRSLRRLLDDRELDGEC